MAQWEVLDAIARLEKLCGQVEDWPRVAHFLQLLIEVEGDEEEASRMTRRLAEILHEKLNRGDEALAALRKQIAFEDGAFVWTQDHGKTGLCGAWIGSRMQLL